MGTMASQITSLTIVYSTVYSGADQRKHQSSASLAFVWGIHRGPVNSPHKWPVTRAIVSIWWRHHDVSVYFYIFSGIFISWWHDCQCEVVSFSKAPKVSSTALSVGSSDWFRLSKTAGSHVDSPNDSQIGKLCVQCCALRLWMHLKDAGKTLRWRHNERDGVSNHQPHHCLLKRLYRRRSKETSNLRVTGLCARNSPVNSPHKKPIRGKCFHLMTSSWKNPSLPGDPGCPCGPVAPATPRCPFLLPGPETPV